MALFDRDADGTMARMNKTAGPGEINMIGAGTVVEGTLRAEGDIRVSGRLVGTLHVDGKAVIAEEGTIDGELIASSADVAGHIDGDLRVEDRLLLTSTARVDGTIATGRLVVEEGAVFTGECGMGEALQRKQAQARERRDETANGAPAEADEAAG